MRMKTAILAALMLLVGSLSFADTTTLRFGLTQPTTTTADVWGAKINNNAAIIDAGAAGQGLYNVMTDTNVFTQAMILTYGTAGQCLALDTNQSVISQQCTAGSGGSNALAVVNGFSTLITSPTPVMNFLPAQFQLKLTGAATAQIDLSPFSTYYIQNNATPQVAQFSISTGTISTLIVTTFTATSSATLTNANIAGPTLAYSSGTFLNSVAIGTTNVNGQAIRIMDTNGSGVGTFETAANQTQFWNVKNNTAGSSAGILSEVLGLGGDSFTGAIAGDGEIKTTANLYLVAGGPTAGAPLKISSNTAIGVIISTFTASTGTVVNLNTNTLKFADGTSQTTAAGGGTFIQNRSTLQSGATAYPDFLYVGSSATISKISVSTETVSSLTISTFTASSGTVSIVTVSSIVATNAIFGGQSFVANLKYGTIGSNSSFLKSETGYCSLGQSIQSAHVSGSDPNSVFIGDSAGISATDVTNGVFVGIDAGANTSGNNNVMIGFNAGFLSAAGDQNVFIGAGAGYAGAASNTSGAKNTLVGYNSAASASSQEAGAFGYYSYANCNDCTVLNDMVAPNQYHLVGINQPTPLAALHVVSNSIDSYAVIVASSTGIAPYLLTVSTQGGVGFYPQTIAQLQQMVPLKTGEMFYLSNGANALSCISTGTVKGSYASMQATNRTTACN